MGNSVHFSSLFPPFGTVGNTKALLSPPINPKSAVIEPKVEGSPLLPLGKPRPQQLLKVSVDRFFPFFSFSFFPVAGVLVANKVIAGRDAASTPFPFSI